MNNFLYGFFYPFRCIKLFFYYPKLIVYSIVPIIINLIIYGTIFFYVYNWITGKSEEIIQPGELNKMLFEFIQFFIKIFSFILVLIICYFAFIIFGGIVSAPFNETISKYIEEKMFGNNINSDISFFKDVWISIREELKKILFYFFIMIPILLIDFIPMIGSSIAIILGSLFSFFYNALDFLDYPLTRRMVKFKEKLKIVNSKTTLSYGFGCIAFLMMFLPVINVFFKPLLVVSGTKLFYEKKYLINNNTLISPPVNY